MFFPRLPSAYHTIPQILEHSIVSHSGSCDILLFDMIFQAQDGLRGMKTHDLSDLKPQEPDVNKESRMTTLAEKVEVNPWKELSWA